MPQRKLESALLESARASCPKNTIRLDPDLSRAARRYTEDAKMTSGAPESSGLAFYASLESVDPAPTGGVATVDNPLQADRAVGDLLPKSCHYNVAGVASGRTASVMFASSGFCVTTRKPSSFTFESKWNNAS